MKDYYVYKCALESNRLVSMLVKFYNVVITFNHYPSRWVKLVDFMLEKGKGPNLNKFRILEMIETDTQLVMRMCLGGRTNNRIEMDKRM